MMDRTDRHFRFLLRQISLRTLLYTEMVTTQAILRSRNPRLLEYDPCEHPLALQLGGDSARELSQCARIGEDLGYDEVNLNCGCPSDRVQSGRFGVVLMKHPEVVAEAVSAMKAAVRIPVSVKHRIGVDDRDSYEDMMNFVDTVAASGADRFTVHARKAWLQGLSPKENRTVPPLRYGDVLRLKRERPELVVELNGGIQNLDQALHYLRDVDAVMIGRAAYDDPFLFAEADTRVFGDPPSRSPDRKEVLQALIPYAERVDARPFAIARHLLGVFSGRRGGRAYRRVLSSEGPKALSFRLLVERAVAAYDEAQGSARAG